MKALTFTSPTHARFELSADVLATMSQHVQDEKGKPESGGVMLGRYLLDTPNVVVDILTTPMPGDQQTRYNFYRAERDHQRVIDQCWHESRSTCNYLGEWHTHPEPDPAPSRLDLRNWRRKLEQDQFDSDVLFFVIVGEHHIRAWQGHCQSGNIAPLMLLQLKGSYG